MRVIIRDEKKRQQFSTRLAFLVAGVGFSTLAPLVPALKVKFGLDEGALGLLLLCVGLGSIAVMPFGGVLAGRFGCRKIIMISGLALCLSLPCFIFAFSPWMLGLSLFLMGAGGGTLDVVMNIQAVVVEEQSGRPMMSGFHGMFSVGGILGAGSLTGLLSLGVKPVFCQMAICGVCAFLLGIADSGMLSTGPERQSEDRKGLVLPRGRVLLIGILCLIVFMAEGSVADWSGVLLTKFRGIPVEQGGLGYIAFAAMMTLNRLTGDRVVARLGREKIVFLGSLCGAAGFVLAATVPFWFVNILGFAMVGIGLANVVPILFSATGRQQDMPPNIALSSVSTMGYIGLLVGPPFLGFIARQSSLPWSLLVLAGLCCYVTISTKQVCK